MKIFFALLREIKMRALTHTHTTSTYFDSFKIQSSLNGIRWMHKLYAGATPSPPESDRSPASIGLGFALLLGPLDWFGPIFQAHY